MSGSSLLETGEQLDLPRTATRQELGASHRTWRSASDDTLQFRTIRPGQLEASRHPTDSLNHSLISRIQTKLLLSTSSLPSFSPFPNYRVALSSFDLRGWLPLCLQRVLGQ